MSKAKNNKKDDQAPVSFLNEAQLEGKAQGEVKMDLDEAISVMHKIVSDEDLKEFSQKKDEDWEPIRMAMYCHDCRAIVPPGISGKGKKMRTVCGVCKSKKISSGREEALRKYYGLEEKKEGAQEKDAEPKKEEKKREPKNKKPKRETKK